MNTCCIDESYKHNVEYTMLSKGKQTSMTICCWISLDIQEGDYSDRNQGSITSGGSMELNGKKSRK